MPRQITPRTTLENLKREAKRWLKALRANVADARDRLRRVLPNSPEEPTLRQVQHALALEYGLSGWTELKNRLPQSTPIRYYESVAEAVVTAYGTGEDSAMRIVWDYFGHMRAWDGMRRYVRLDLGKTEQPKRPEDDAITLVEAQYLVARMQGFESWQALVEFAASVPPGKTIAAKSVSTFSTDETGVKEETRSRDWDEIIAAMAERQLPGLHASGQMTDALLHRFSRLDH
ncbi:MAG TPA: hypothetical protein VK516_10990, partial [Gemmatimonadaceae bacterium]|nr:hypothetical protein [Gemmatimonadaceae bacterium]